MPQGLLFSLIAVNYKSCFFLTKLFFFILIIFIIFLGGRGHLQVKHMREIHILVIQNNGYVCLTF